MSDQLDLFDENQFVMEHFVVITGESFVKDGEPKPVVNTEVVTELVQRAWARGLEESTLVVARHLERYKPLTP